MNKAEAFINDKILAGMKNQIKYLKANNIGDIIQSTIDIIQGQVNTIEERRNEWETPTPE